MKSKQKVNGGGAESSKSPLIKRTKLNIVLFLMTILIVGVGTSYAWIRLTVSGTKKQQIDPIYSELILTEENEGIQLTDAFPVADPIGKSGTKFEFNIYNKGQIPLDYTVYLQNGTLESGKTRMSETKIKTFLVKNGEEGMTKLLSSLVSDSNGRVLDSGVIKSQETINYSLNLWIAENVTEIGENEAYSGKLYVVGMQQTPKTLFVEAEITGGSIVGERSYVVDKGETKTFTFEPKPGYTLGSVYCSNEQETNYDENTNVLTLNNITKNSTCQVVYAYDFSCADTNNFGECLIKYPDDTGMIETEHDSTAQMIANTDYRYVGANPNNYIYYNCKDGIDYSDKANYNTQNCELWRIIGVFDVDDGTGNYEQRVKIIRSSYFGTLQWNSVNQNSWYNASLMKLFNSGDYYNRTGLYTEIGLTNNAKNMIKDAKFYLGGSSGGSPDSFYKQERGEIVTVGRDINWTGQVALMYATDYGYATKNATCKNSMNSTECKSGNWLYKGEGATNEWTLSPNSGLASSAYYVASGGGVSSNGIVTTAYPVRPVVYLKSDIQKVQGLGTEQKPFILE